MTSSAPRTAHSTSQSSKHSQTRQRSQQRRIAAATIAGTTVEWYDFMIYAQAAALVFAPLFFEPAGESAGILLSLASVGISFLFRPLGAAMAGHLGERYGRRPVLVGTLLLMGVATTLIGLLPTYHTVGMLAPVLLVFLRILQGISAGGEWGGAAMMAVEHAPGRRRGLAGTYPQLGVPLGMLLASGTFALMTGVISPGDAFIEWGWRVPFLVSIVLVFIGHMIRRSVDESPVFQEMNESAVERPRVPLKDLFSRHPLLVLVAALLFAGNNAGGYMIVGGFVTGYATNALGMDRTGVLLAVSFAAAVWFFSTLASGFLCDRIGRRNTFLLGFVCLIAMAFPLFWFVGSGAYVMIAVGLGLYAIGLGLSYGPQAAWYAELFPADVRFAGVSITYALGAIVGGAFAPFIAQWLLDLTGTTLAISTYLTGMFLVGTVSALLLRDEPGRPLGIEHLDEQRERAKLRV